MCWVKACFVKQIYYLIYGKKHKILTVIKLNLLHDNPIIKTFTFSTPNVNISQQRMEGLSCQVFRPFRNFVELKA